MGPKANMQAKMKVNMGPKMKMNQLHMMAHTNLDLKQHLKRIQHGKESRIVLFKQDLKRFKHAKMSLKRAHQHAKMSLKRAHQHGYRRSNLGLKHVRNQVFSMEPKGLSGSNLGLQHGIIQVNNHANNCLLQDLTLTQFHSMNQILGLQHGINNRIFSNIQSMIWVNRTSNQHDLGFLAW